eukprot:3917994-Heterocapsa_arctica.AAC.1
MRQYDDATSLAAVGALVEVLGMTAEEGLEAIGGFHVRFVARQGWVFMLRSMGRSLHEFLDNFNELHHFLGRDFRQS